MLPWQKLNKPSFLPALFTGLIGTFLSLFVFYLAHRLENRGLENQFKLLATDRIDVLQDVIDENLSVLEAIRSFYGASQLVERHEFRDFVSLFLSEYPSVLALEWAPKVNRREKDQFLGKVREEGFSDFEILEEDAGQHFIKAAARDEYFPVYFIEPYSSYRSVLGFDLSASEERQSALIEARDTGQMTATQRFRLAGPFESKEGFLVFLPIYAAGPRSESIIWRRQHLKGIVTGVYRLDDILVKSFNSLKPRGVSVRVYQGAVESSENLIYELNTGKSFDRDYKKFNVLQLSKSFYYERIINVAGKQWKILCVPSQTFFQTNRSYRPFLILFLCLLTSGLIVRYIYTHTYKTIIIENLVRQRTVELTSAKENLEKEILQHQETEKRLMEMNEKWRSLVGNAPDIIITISLDGTIQFINKTAQGLTVEEVLNRKVYEFVPAAYRDFMKNVFDLVIRTEENQSFDVPTQIAGQELRWYRSNVGAIKSKGKVVGLMIITADITEQKAMEDKVKNSKNFLNKIIDSVADPIFVKDRRHHYVLMNEVLCKMMGRTQEELIGKSDFDFFPKNQADIFLEKDELVFNSGQTNINEEEFTDKDGTIRMISTKKSLYVDAAGNQHIVGIIRDITEAKKIEKALLESQHLYADLFEGAPDPIIRLSPLGNFEAVNPAAEKIFGKSKDELLGVHFSQAGVFTPVSKTKLLNEFHLVAFGEKRPPMELEVVRSDEENRIYEANLRAVQKNGRTEGLQIIFRDITDRKHREEVEVKSRFVSTVSHELRTPLQSIREGLNVILDRSVGDITKEQEEFLEIVKRNVERLGRLIDNVLDFQKIDAVKNNLFLEKGLMNEAVKEVAKMMKSMIENQGLQLRLSLASSEPFIKVDHDKIRQVLINLMDNAIKFTKKGKIEIVTEKIPGAIKVSVKDTGVGIKKEDLPHLFKAFAQIKTPSGKSGSGTGLGLAISRQIIEQHGGQIDVESEFGKGSAFWFTIPILTD